MIKKLNYLVLKIVYIYKKLKGLELENIGMVNLKNIPMIHE